MADGSYIRSQKETAVKQSIAKSAPHLRPLALVMLQHWFSNARASTQQAQKALTAFQPQTPEAEALQAIYSDILTLCLTAMEEATTAHLPDELAALLAYEHAELDALTETSRRVAPAAAD